MKNIILIDTHAHVNFSDFKSDSKEVIKRGAGQWSLDDKRRRGKEHLRTGGEDGGRIQRRSLCGGWTASQPFDWSRMEYEENGETVKYKSKPEKV